MWWTADTDTGKSINQKVGKTNKTVLSIANIVDTDISAKINNNLSQKQWQRTTIVKKQHFKIFERQQNAQ